MKQKFSPSIIEALKYYVYLYVHPISKKVFYVGKGKGNREFAHLEDDSESHKVSIIKELATQGLKPEIEILIHGLQDEETALRVEASIIDLIGIDNLTNKQSGYRSNTFGRMTIDQINSTYQRESVDIKDPSILIRINKAFRYNMGDQELYDWTRGQWKLSLERAKKAKYAMAVYQGIIHEVYEIKGWYKGNETLSIRILPGTLAQNGFEGESGAINESRSEFVGNFAPYSIRSKYKYKSVEHYFKKGNANPILYVNI